MSNARFLEEIGLTNKGTEDIGVLATAPTKIKSLAAFCTSHKCCSEDGERITERMLKSVHKTTIFCPECRQALVWKLTFKDIT